MTPSWPPSVKRLYLQTMKIVKGRKYHSVAESRAVQMATNAYTGEDVDTYEQAARLARKAAIIDEVWEPFAVELAKRREP